MHAAKNIAYIAVLSGEGTVPIAAAPAMGIEIATSIMLAARSPIRPLMSMVLSKALPATLQAIQKNPAKRRAAKTRKVVGSLEST